MEINKIDYSKYECPYSHLEKECGHELHSPEGYQDTYSVWCQCGFHAPVLYLDPIVLGLKIKDSSECHATLGKEISGCFQAPVDKDTMICSEMGDLRKELDQFFTKDATEVVMHPKRLLTGDPQELWLWVLNNFTMIARNDSKTIKEKILNDLEISIKCLNVYSIEPAIIKDILTKLNQLRKT